jgi:CBS domain-containing protein
MQVRDVMTESLTFCPPEKTLDEVARMMVACDCGAVPVVDLETQKVIGIVTDRDIVCRAVAMGRDPVRVTAEDVMTMPITAVGPADSIETCVAEMERAQVRRMPVVDDQGRLRGIVSQADIARVAPAKQTGHLVHDVSRSTDRPSQVHE